MIRKRAIKRMFLSLMWLCVGAGMVTLITAAMKVQNSSQCEGYTINITGADQDKLFTTKENIEKLLKVATKGEVKGQRMSEFDLPKMEDLLEQSAWVYNAELYFDNRNILNVNVIERKPLARVFTNLGESYYIDESGRRIPLSEKISLDVPVFTGFPTKKVLNAEDSSLMRNVIATASFINDDTFWSSQVSQIDLNHQGVNGWQMEMVPVVGNHRVKLGDGSDIATKFHRLYLFYDQVLKRKGFDKYQTINVQYDGQVVGVKGDHNKIDSLQLRKNIENLLAQSRDANERISETPNIGLSNYVMDTVSSQALYQPAEPQMDDTVSVAVAVDKPVEKPAIVVEKKPEPVKKEIKSAEKEKPAVKKPEVKKVDKKVEEKKPEAKAVVKTEPKKVIEKESKPAVKKETAKKEVKQTAKTPVTKTTAAPSTAKPKNTEKKPVAKAEVKKPAAKPSEKANEKKATAAKPVANKKETNKTTTKKSN